MPRKIPKSCEECENLTNSSRLHNCAFTAAPYPMTWYCEAREKLEIVFDTEKRPDWCPLNPSNNACLEKSKQPEGIITKATVFVDSDRLLSWLAENAKTWALVRKNNITKEQKEYAEGCMMAFLSVEAWVKNYSVNEVEQANWRVQKGDWIFERSSGYSGYRCRKCGKWEYAEKELKCDCDLD